ncbi:GGDEF domain-containing protein [Sulfidibacter corallicola]
MFPLIRTGLYCGAALFMAMVAIDAYFLGESWRITLPMRSFVALILVTTAFLSARFERLLNVDLVFLGAASLASLANVYIFTFYPSQLSLILIAVQLVLGIFVAALAPTLRILVLGQVLVFSIPSAFMFLVGQDGVVQLQADISLGLGCVALTSLGMLLDQSFRYSFRMEREVELVTQVDRLTGVKNFRHFMQLAWTEQARTRRFERPLSAFLISIDDLSDINANYGIHTGDEVLRSVASACVSSMREVDVFARTGGDTFGALLPETDIESALILANRLRRMLDELEVNSDPERLNLSFSLGVATMESPSESVEVLLERAERALARSRELGHGEVVSLQQRSFAAV